jgi:putative transposase
VLRLHRRRVGRRWAVGEVFCSRGQQKLDLSRAGDQRGQVLEVLLRDRRDRASAEAFFRHARARPDGAPEASLTARHQPYIKAVATLLPVARQGRTGGPRRRGYTPQPIERRHVPTRDRLRGARGLRTVPTGQKLLGSFEAFHALRRGKVNLCALVSSYRPTRASVHETARAIVMAIDVLGTQLRKAA